MTMSPDEQTAIAVTAIVYEMTADDILQGMDNALAAGASPELILRDYSASLLLDLGHPQCASLAVTFALMLAQQRRKRKT